MQNRLCTNTGSSLYFRFSHNLTLPRLHLAIEHNHKEFVGHPLSQQVFRHFYEQSVPWSGEGNRFRTLHVLLQILLAPLMVFMSIFVWIGRGVSSKNGIDENEPSLYGIKKCYHMEVDSEKKLSSKGIFM